MDGVVQEDGVLFTLEEIRAAKEEVKAVRKAAKAQPTGAQASRMNKRKDIA
jgi:hypothetical protein